MNKAKRILAVALAIVLLSRTMFSQMSGAKAAERGISHGTADHLITEEELSLTPPADYVINPETQGEAEDGKYPEYFLKEDIQTVSIEIDENNLNYMLQNAKEKPTVMTTSVTIADVTLGYCGLKTKGNYTLEHSYNDNRGNDRFSFTINFGSYIKKADYGSKQNFFGCDKISFNNFFFDKSMMKEFFALKLLDEMGLPTPAYGLAKLYINGDYYGVYAMVEAMDESILERYYGVDDSNLSSYLCKPEGTSFLYEDILDDDSPLWEGDRETYEDVQDMLPTVTEWVRKLNCLSEGKDFENNTLDVNSETYLQLLAQVLDVDEVVKYFAVHSWLCQLDNMFVGYQNFGLYVDPDGVAMIVPWDYDLSFGCYYPSTAEATANFDIDAMYRKSQGRESEEELKALEVRIYKEFPLFYVIYQNESLMEKYHEYMGECSKIAALGGTVASTGKSYEPAYFNSFITAMEDEVVKAASETLADNVDYMNHTNQPLDVYKALPNLSKIIAMRSVGVYVQVNGLDTMVCGSGCDLSTLGNASRGNSTANGRVTAVDSATGIFATAEYSGQQKGPQLTVKIPGAEEESYQIIKTALAPEENTTLIVYTLENRTSPDTAYTVTIPVSPAAGDGAEVRIYSCTGGTPAELTATADGNLYTVSVDTLGTIAVTLTAAEAVGADGTVTDETEGTAPDFYIYILAAAAVIVLAGVVTVVILKRKKAR